MRRTIGLSVRYVAHALCPRRARNASARRRESCVMLRGATSANFRAFPSFSAPIGASTSMRNALLATAGMSREGVSCAITITTRIGSRGGRLLESGGRSDSWPTNSISMKNRSRRCTRILDELKIERAQAEVDDRRATAEFADAVEGDSFDAARAGGAGERRVQSAARLRETLTRASREDPRTFDTRAAPAAGLLDPQRRSERVSLACRIRNLPWRSSLAGTNRQARVTTMLITSADLNIFEFRR